MCSSDLLKLFPFGGTRHSIYLLPLVCLPAGAAVQYGFDVLKKLFPAAAVNQRAPYVYGILAAMVIFLTGALAYTLKGYTYSPQYNGGMEFPVPRADYDRIMRYLMHSAQQPGALLTDLQTYHYFAFSNQEEESGKKTQLTNIALGFLTFDWQDFGGYLIFVWEFNNREIINAALQALKKHAVLTRFPTIYLVNIGWESGFIETVRTADPLYKTVFKKQLLLPGGYVYALSAQEVQRQIDAGRFQNPPVEAEQQGALKK